MNGTIKELKQGLLKCANENKDRTYLTGQVIISLICECAKDTIEELEKENEKLKQLIDIAKITIKMIENTEDTFEKAFCLKKLKELLGDTNDKI